MPMQGILASAGKKPTTPTIGTATDGGTGTTVSVAFTPSTYIGKGTITYTATSSPGGLTASGSGSPITVSGLTTGTAYTFTVQGNTNYGVLSDSSAASNSVTPASPSSFESIATATGTGSSGTITFSSIPSTYKHLQVRLLLRGSATSTNYSAKFQLNGDTGNNYAYHILLGDGTSVSATGSSSSGDMPIFRSASASYNTGVMGVAIADIIDYASTTKNKTVKVLTGVDNNSTTGGYISLNSGLWINTAAVNSLTITVGANTFTTATQVALYGIKG